MRGKYRQAVVARTGEWSTGSSTSSGEEHKVQKFGGRKIKELRARIEALEKRGGEGAQGGQGLPSRRESGMEEEWRMDMDVEEEIETRKNLDEQKRKLQKELREFEKFLVIVERGSGKPQEKHAAATARDGAKEA